LSPDLRAHTRSIVALAAFIFLAGAACTSPPPPIDREPVPGTRVSLSLPPGFRTAERFTGIVDPSGSTSVIVTENDDPVETTFDKMNEREFANRGMRWVDSEKLDIDDRKALLIHAVEPVVGGPDRRRSIAVFGDGKHTVILAAATTRPALEEEVGVLRDVLVTAAWDPDKAIDPYLGLGFRLTGTSLLALSDRLPSLVSFTVGGNRGKLKPHDPLFIAGTSATSSDVSDIEAFGRYQLIQTSEFEVSEIQSSRLTKLDGLPAHEIEAIGNDRATGTPLAIHQTVVLGADRYFLLQGMVGRRNAGEVMPHFRKIAGSFQAAR
jgi:hypothetical protein